MLYWLFAVPACPSFLSSANIATENPKYNATTVPKSRWQKYHLLNATVSTVAYYINWSMRSTDVGHQFVLTIMLLTSSRRNGKNFVMLTCVYLSIGCKSEQPAVLTLVNFKSSSAKLKLRTFKGQTNFPAKTGTFCPQFLRYFMVLYIPQFNENTSKTNLFLID